MSTVLYPAKDGRVLNYPNSPDPYMGAVFFETFLYGIYVLLFGCCMVILLRKERIPWITLLSTVVMFSLASADMGYTLYLVFQKLVKTELTYEALHPKYVMYVVNSAIADTLLLYRCYLFWGSQKWVVVGPAILLVAATACGFVFEGMATTLERYSWINLSLSVAVNIIITTMTAGRVVYIFRSAHVILGEDMSRRYQSTFAVTIESGFIYTLYVSLDLILRHNATAKIILDAGLVQAVGIMPALIIVRIFLERVTRGGATSLSHAGRYTTGESVLSHMEHPWNGVHGRARGSRVVIPFTDMTPQSARFPGRLLQDVVV